MFAAKRLLKYLFVGGLALSVLTGCEISEDDQGAIDDAFNPAPTPLPDDILNNQLCYSDQFVQPDFEISKKLDLLFVIDTSGSIHSEREAIANGIDSFLDELPADIDLNISVMLAHGSTSSKSGKLYSYGRLPKVLKSSELTTTEIKTNLAKSMKYTSSDYDADGGELGLYSLNAGITTNLEDNKANGFFRDDSALAVVFVADENDICALGNYPQGVEPVYDRDKKEPSAYDRDCAGITPDVVLNNLKSIQGDLPLLVSGIIYTDPDTTPAGGENEVGYGYLETVLLANGGLVDLANGDYSQAMRDIGYMAIKKLSLLTEFVLSETDFDPSTIEVTVDRAKVDFQYIPELNEVQISDVDAGSARSSVYVTYCVPENSVKVIISNIQFGETNASSTIITWITDVPATSMLEYTNVLTGQMAVSVINSALTTSHFEILEGLTPNTLYSIRVISASTDGQTSVSSPFTVRTAR